MTNGKKTKILFLITAALSVIAALTYMMAIGNDYEAVLGYFKVGSVFAISSYVCFGAAVVLGIVSWFLCRRDATVKSGAFKQNVLSKVTTILLAFAVLVNFLQETMQVKVTSFQRFYQVIYASRILGVLCAVALVVNALISNRSKTVACLLSFFPPLYFACKVLCNYFDQNVAVNSLPKLIFQVTLIALMLAFTAEAGMALGRGQIYHRYVAVLNIASVLSFACGIAGAVNSLSTSLSPYTFTQSLVLFCGGLYCLAALYNCDKLNFIKTDDKYSEFFEIMQRKADERNEAENESDADAEKDGEENE